jgi:hypothetical protein
VGARTIYRWIAEQPAFARRVGELRSQMFGEAVGVLSVLARGAVVKLGQLLESKAEGISLQAARSILEHGPRLREATEIEARLTALEARREPAQRPLGPAGAHRNGVA